MTLKNKKNARVILSYFPGAYVLQVKATDADDPTYGNSARVVYSILQGQPYFSIDPKTGKFFIRDNIITSPSNIEVLIKSWHKKLPILKQQ